MCNQLNLTDEVCDKYLKEIFTTLWLSHISDCSDCHNIPSIKKTLFRNIIIKYGDLKVVICEDDWQKGKLHLLNRAVDRLLLV